MLFQPAEGPLLLFYKVGPSPREWWGLVRTSPDPGRTWSDAIALPPGILGPIRAKPVALNTGELLAGSSTEHAGWVVHIERFAGPVGALGSGSGVVAQRAAEHSRGVRGHTADDPRALAHAHSRSSAAAGRAW